ncbi:MmgE/PrpD family protein [Kordiimonas aestuarii]|uniref:MmgE/PrpD family protein n=1 Tax=Kordiimonas aestuarii TaxID=1005925 RepID=UPI0021D0B1DD|nr:MmgE/PrpD family protein [Kordiimonas aestuarii]
MTKTKPASIAQQIAVYAASLSYADLSAHAVKTVKQRVLDSLACALGAYDAQPVVAGRRYARTVPVNRATLIGTAERTTADTAAFVNGTMVRYLDYNDGYIGKELGHPSDNIPACLAVAEAEGKSGQDLILAIVLGYEVQCRLQDAARLYSLGWDHVNYVLISVAVAAGKLMGLSADQLTQAINMAAGGHVALRQVRAGELSGWKGCSAANAARNAIVCAALAREGLTGPSPIFEGEMGFIKQLSLDMNFDITRFATAENPDYAITHTLTKLLPTQGEIQTAVWAALKLRPQIADLDAVKSIHVETTNAAYRITARDAEKWRPRTRETADHSLPFTVARAFLDGGITMDSYSDESLRDNRIIPLMDKITAAEDPALTATFPRHIANRVTVTLKSGEVLTEQVDTARGGMDTPMTDEDFEAKFDDVAQKYLSNAQAGRVRAFVWQLDGQGDFTALFDALRVNRPAAPDA